MGILGSGLIWGGSIYVGPMLKRVGTSVEKRITIADYKSSLHKLGISARKLRAEGEFMKLRWIGEMHKRLI